MSQESQPEPEAPIGLGLHIVIRERDLSHVKLNGPLNLAEAEVMHGMLADTLERYGTVYVLVDSSEAGTLPPETRRWIAEWNKRHVVTGVAIYGSSVVVRALISLVLHASALLRSNPVPSVFLKTETEARAWLAALPRR